MDHARLVYTKLNLSRLGVGYRLGHILRHRSHLRIWHQTTRAQHLTQLADNAHRTWRCDANIKVDRSALDGFSKIFQPNNICASRLRGFDVIAVSKNSYPHSLASALWQHSSAADILI